MVAFVCVCESVGAFFPWWYSVAAADAKYYGNMDIYNLLKARGAKVPKTRKTPMAVANPKEVPEYELNPFELQGMYQVAKWNGTKVAVKILDKDSYSDPESINAFKNELTLLEKVRHPNIIQFVGAVTQNIPMMIVVEYHSKGDLGGYLQKKGRLSPSKSLKFALDIASGGQLKVAGFGLVRLSKISADKFKLAEPGACTRNASVYTAPELYVDEIFDKSVDVFSFAVIVYEMIEGVHPFHPKPAEEAIKLMCLEGKRPPFKKLKNYPSELKELIEACWSSDPSVRPCFTEIILRLDSVVAHGCKQGWWKDTFKLPWL
ncbi:Integrin-linked protein kinase 1 [Bienertia sinuspersici]